VNPSSCRGGEAIPRRRVARGPASARSPEGWKFFYDPTTQRNHFAVRSHRWQSYNVATAPPMFPIRRRPTSEVHTPKLNGPKGLKNDLICEPCVFCGHEVEVRRDQLRGAETFAICPQDEARLDAALARVARDVLALLHSPRG